MAVLDKIIWNNTILAWLLFVGGSLFIFLFLRFLKWFLSERLFSDDRVRKLNAAKAANLVVRTTRTSFLVAVSLYVAGFHLDLGERAREAIGPVVTFLLLFQFWRWGSELIEFFVNDIGLKSVADDGAKQTTLHAISVAVKILLFVTLVILGLDRIGINVTPIVAGLGVGGIAITLALQAILGDVFASIIIVLDKPFVIGDFIVTDNFSGTIENIGVKTTRARSVNGELLIFPNGNLLQSRLRNYKRMTERRVVVNVGVRYDTPVAKLKQIPSQTEAIIKAQPNTRYQRTHLNELRDSSINFEIVYSYLSPDFDKHIAVQEQILLRLLEQFESDGVGIAFPTRELVWQEKATPPEFKVEEVKG